MTAAIAPAVSTCTRAAHLELKASDELWFALHYVGAQAMRDGGDDLELRDCPWCRSTLARPVPKENRR